MIWFHDLVVHGNAAALGKLIATIESHLEPNWHRDLETERRAARVKDPRLYLIRCRKTSGDIGFALAECEGVICVDNVFAYPGKCVSAPEYGALLEDFFRTIVKPAADELGLRYFSSGFEDRFPQSAKRHRRRSAIEIALGFGVVLRLRAEGYLSRFPVRSEADGGPIDQLSMAHRLLKIYPSRQN
ncbi:MAG: hypothetical protein IVW54_02500 [Candidatus Binataceae bacterium]|nr:hypothetical protein [Candidatus Binataceae bacterium]